MATAILYLLAYIFLALLPVTLAVVRTPTVGGSFLYELGRNIALAAFSILAIQPVLTARFSLIDGSFGTVNCLRFHKAMGVLALGFALLHPISLAVGGAGPRLLTSWDSPWFVVVGRVALLILTIHVVFALLRSTLRLNYQNWKNVHAVASTLILMGGFVHSWFAGADLNIFQLQAYWIALLMLAAAALFHKRIKVGSGAAKMKGRQGRGGSL